MTTRSTAKLPTPVRGEGSDLVRRVYMGEIGVWEFGVRLPGIHLPAFTWNEMKYSCLELLDLYSAYSSRSSLHKYTLKMSSRESLEFP